MRLKYFSIWGGEQLHAPARVGAIAARVWAHRRHEEGLGGDRRAAVRTADRDVALLQRLPDFQGIASKLGYLVRQDLLVQSGKRPRHVVGNLATWRAEPLGPAGRLFGLTHERPKVYH